MVASLAIFNGVYPAITQSSGVITSATDKVNDRIKSQIEIIQVNDNETTVDVWVKNVGSSYIDVIERCDIFFGPQGNLIRVNYGEEGTPLPYWNYQLEGNASEWGPQSTIKATINLDATLTAGLHLFKMVLPNGVANSITFGVE